MNIISIHLQCLYNIFYYIQFFIWGSVLCCLRGVESCLRIVIFHILLALRLNVFYALRILPTQGILPFFLAYGTQNCLFYYIGRFQCNCQVLGVEKYSAHISINMCFETVAFRMRKRTKSIGPIVGVILNLMGIP